MQLYSVARNQKRHTAGAHNLWLLDCDVAEIPQNFQFDNRLSGRWARRSILERTETFEHAQPGVKERVVTKECGKSEVRSLRPPTKEGASHTKNLRKNLKVNLVSFHTATG